MPGRKYDLEERLLEYAAAIVKLTEAMPNTRAANHVGGQLLRSGTSPLFNQGEAQAAESPNDFVHKMKICLKELRETSIWLRIIARKRLSDHPDITPHLSECNELIAIFVSSIMTAEHRLD